MRGVICYARAEGSLEGGPRAHQSLGDGITIVMHPMQRNKRPRPHTRPVNKHAVTTHPMRNTAVKMVSAQRMRSDCRVDGVVVG